MTDRNTSSHEAFAEIVAALRRHAAALTEIDGLVAARPGYTLEERGPVPTLVLAYRPGQVPTDTADLARLLGVKVRATLASAAEQIRGAQRPSFVSSLLARLDPTEPAGFAPPRRGNYEPPTGPDAPVLDPIDEEMEVTVCASPDAGWPVLRGFLAEGVSDRLTVAMYDFTAPHVESALTDALKSSGATLRLVLDGRAASGGVGGTGINGADSKEADVMARLDKALKNRFELSRASVGAGGAVPRAYHIKVAVADGERLWLSSGNWQSSNLPKYDWQVAGDAPPFPLRRYNRDYHAVVKNPKLAACYAAFIEHDATLGGAFAGPEEGGEPVLLVPDDAGEPPSFAPIQRFPPLTVRGRVKVTPLLTPDNFPAFVNQRLARAKKRVWVQNQYIQPQAEGDNFPEFEELMRHLGELGSTVDLRLCLRGVEESDRDRLLEAGVTPAQIRRQSNCHAKLIIIDDDLVIVGSQNWSNLGFVANRDASLAFEHRGIVDYFASVFDADWQRASPLVDGDSFGARLATDESTPAGYVRAPWSSVFDAPPPAVPPVSSLPKTPVPPPPAPAVEVPFFGVDDEGRRATARVGDLASALRGASGGIDDERRRLGRISVTASFGLPPGTSAENLDEVGWGVLWAPGTPQAIKDALAPLLAHRRAEVNDDLLFHEMDVLPGQSARAFLQAHNADFGSIKPNAVPYHLLIVGGPDALPFTFQSVLDVEYRVGRLDLGDAAAHARYVRSLLAVEQGKAKARDRVLHAFGPAHPGDEPTELSVAVLVRAAAEWLDAFPKLKQKHQLGCQTDAGDDATKARLLDLLRGAGGRPEVLFTAGHGLMLSSGHKRQRAEQGALITADWDGFAPIDASCRVSAADVPADADLEGLVAFLFACFGAGTPATDSFPTCAGQPLAPKPFLSALPRALLSHEKGAALGVFGHVDRTLTWSLQPPGAPVATDPFARAALHVLAGNRLGAALEDLNHRGATLAHAVAAALAPNAPPLDDAELVRTWTQQRDACAFMLLGDPAARLPR